MSFLNTILMYIQALSTWNLDCEILEIVSRPRENYHNVKFSYKKVMIDILYDSETETTFKFILQGNVPLKYPVVVDLPKGDMDTPFLHYLASRLSILNQEATYDCNSI